MTQPTAEAPVGKWTRVTGTDREALRERAKRLYVDEQKSVRDVATEIGRSYGAAHRLLVEAGVQFRPRGNHA